MGYMRHHAIIVTGEYGRGNPGEDDYEHWAHVAHRAATEIADGTCVKVTSVTPVGMNGARSFLVAPDGSKEGWADSDAGDIVRSRFIGWLKAQCYDDGSCPLNWALVQYGDDDLDNRLVMDDSKLRMAAR